MVVFILLSIAVRNVLETVASLLNRGLAVDWFNQLPASIWEKGAHTGLKCDNNQTFKNAHFDKTQLLHTAWKQGQCPRNKQIMKYKMYPE